MQDYSSESSGPDYGDEEYKHYKIDDIQLLEKIGEGGQAEVFLAEVGKQLWALKVFY